MQRYRLLVLSLSLVCSLVVACDPSSPSNAAEADADGPPEADAGALLATGEVCDFAKDCEGNQCIRLNALVQTSVCTNRCQDDDDCPAESGYACGTGAGGAAQCVPPCGRMGIACVDSRPVLCTELIGSHYCFECGCPSGQMCSVDGTCKNKDSGDVGDTCQRDDQCKSKHCSASAGVCRVGAGEACTASNCDLCIQVSNLAPTFCSRACTKDEECGSGVCGAQGCRPRCASLRVDPYCADGCEARYPDGLNTTTTAYFCPCSLSNCSVIK